MTLLIQFPDFGEIRYMNRLVDLSESVWVQSETPPGSHWEKRTLRPLLTSVVYTLQLNSHRSIYLMFSVLNLLFLFLLVLLLYTNTASRWFSFIYTLSIATTYAGFSGFADVHGWGDILTFCLLMFCLFSRNGFVLTAAVFLSLSNDERTILAIPYIVLFHYLTDKSGEQASLWDKKLLLPISIGVAFFLIMRLIMEFFLGFTTHVSDVGLNAFKLLNPAYVIPMFFSSFEFFWAFPLLLLNLLWLEKSRFHFYLIVTYTIAAVISCYSVYDVTRSLCFLFPLVLASSVYVYQSRICSSVRFACLAIAAMSILFSTSSFYGEHMVYRSFFHFIHDHPIRLFS